MEEVNTPIKTVGAPAIDLQDAAGNPIGGRDEAAQLSLTSDLSKLDPIPNDGWKPESLSLSNAADFNYPPEASEFLFLNDISGTMNYRAQVEYQGRPFRLVVDIDNHKSLIAAALLRKLGYPVDSPQLYRNLRLRFKDLKSMDEFVENFALETGFSRDSWIVKKNEKSFTLDLKDVNLEYPRIIVPLYYEGKINQEWVAGRRAMRALLIPLKLTDIRLSVDSLNIFPWEFGRIFNGGIVIRHPYAKAFQESTFEDFKWIARKIVLFSEEELRAIVNEVRFDRDATALLFEKIKSQRNQLVARFNLEPELNEMRKNGLKVPAIEFKVDTNLTIDHVKKGKILENDPKIAGRFTYGDPDSPLRWAEIKHYFRMEVIAQGIRVLTDEVNKKLQIFTISEGVDKHRQGLIDMILVHFKENPNQPYVVPVAAWSQPLGGLNLSATRSVVTGTYYGSDSASLPQIVDTFAVGASVSRFGGVEGVQLLKNASFTAGVSYQRNYTHVRPIATSLKEVKKMTWKHLFVPGFMKGASKSLKWTELRKKLTHFTAEYSHQERQYVKDFAAYETAMATHKTSPSKTPPVIPAAPEVKTLFERIVEVKWTEDRPIPEMSADPENPADLRGIENIFVAATLKTFISDIRDNEIFTITDSLVNQVSPQVRIPITTIAGMGIADLVGGNIASRISPSVGVSVTGQYAILKRTMMIRHGDQFEIYDTRMKTRMFGGQVDFNAWIQLAKVATQSKKGNIDTQAMRLDLTLVTDKEKLQDENLDRDRKKLLYALADLFQKNEIDTAEEMAPAYAVHHDMKGALKSAKVLFWNWATYAETHQVKITPPADLEHSYNPDQVARTLFSARKMNLNGKNPYGLLGQVVNRVAGTNGLLDSGGSQNPSNTFLGSANWSQVRSEAEITPGSDWKPILTFEDHYAGWYLSRDRLLAILDRLEGEVKELNLGAKTFKREAFAATKQLQAYDIRSSVLIYPSGVKKIGELLTTPRSRSELLYTLLGMLQKDDVRNNCQIYFKGGLHEVELARFESESVLNDSKAWHHCIQPWMRKIMRAVRNIPDESDRAAYIKWLTDTSYVLEKNVDLSRFLNKVGKENFFLQIKVSGFRTQDENGDSGNVDDGYMPDTIGSLGKEAYLGAFRDLVVHTKGDEWRISDYELQGRYFGDGL